MVERIQNEESINYMTGGGEELLVSNVFDSFGTFLKFHEAKSLSDLKLPSCQNTFGKPCPTK